MEPLQPEILDTPFHNFTARIPEYQLDSTAVVATYFVLYSCSTVFGTLGNVLIILAVVFSKKLRSVGNIFIVNLAIADICVSSFVNSFTVVGYVKGEEYFIVHHHLCQAVGSICLTSCFCSLLSIGAISVNRYVHICHHRHYRSIFSPYRTLAIVVLLWVVSFCLQVSCFVGWGDHVYDRKTMSCIYDRTADYSFTVFVCIVGVIMPLVIIAVCYIHIFVYVRRSKIRTLRNSMNLTRPRTSDIRFVKTMVLIVFVFISCWFPYVFIVLYDKEDVLAPAVHTFILLVAHGNSSLNFTIYGLTNRVFRKAYIRIFRVCDVRDFVLGRKKAKTRLASAFSLPTSTVHAVGSEYMLQEMHIPE